MTTDASGSHAAGRFLTARWIHLAMLNYEVEPALLADLVPAGTQLDAWEGRTFVSLVAFQFLGTRVLGVPIPFHRDFDEANLRFYVRRNAPDGVRRGVVFVKEIVPRAAIAWVARRLYNENYVALPMRHRDALDANGGEIDYEWRSGGRWNRRWNRLRVRVVGAPVLADERSEESFISEHYWGYVGQRDGSTLEYQVEHPRWRVWRALDAQLDCDVAGLYGAPFAEPLARAPSSAFLADGSAIVVRRGRPLRATETTA